MKCIGQPLIKIWDKKNKKIRNDINTISFKEGKLHEFSYGRPRGYDYIESNTLKLRDIKIFINDEKLESVMQNWKVLDLNSQVYFELQSISLCDGLIKNLNVYNRKEQNSKVKLSQFQIVLFNEKNKEHINALKE